MSTNCHELSTFHWCYISQPTFLLHSLTRWLWWYLRNLYECDTFYLHFNSFEVNFFFPFFFLLHSIFVIKTFINFKQIFSDFLVFIYCLTGGRRSLTLLPSKYQKENASSEEITDVQAFFIQFNMRRQGWISWCDLTFLLIR